MSLLRLLLTAFTAFFAVLMAITVFFGRLLGRTVRNARQLRPLERKRETEASSDEAIDVETTVVSSDQGER